MKLEGIHHITAITGDAQQNVDFYAGTLGLRLVKKSVNQDQTSVYHLFYADETGDAGSDITFFEYPGLPTGRAGDGMIHRIVWRVSGPEVIDDGVHITTVYMPLVRTPMIAPTKIYDRFPTLSPEEAAGLITDAIRKRPKRIATNLGNLGQLSYALAPGAQDLVVNRAYKLFPEGETPGKGDQRPAQEEATAEQRAFARATRGVHW